MLFDMSLRTVLVVSSQYCHRGRLILTVEAPRSPAGRHCCTRKVSNAPNTVVASRQWSRHLGRPDDAGLAEGLHQSRWRLEGSELLPTGGQAARRTLRQRKLAADTQSKMFCMQMSFSNFPQILFIQILSSAVRSLQNYWITHVWLWTSSGQSDTLCIPFHFFFFWESAGWQRGSGLSLVCSFLKLHNAG